MLEILILISLTSKIGAIVEQKGYQSGGYKWSAVAWWFGGEGGLPMYIIGLVGAAIGASIAHSTANNLLEIGPLLHQKRLSLATHKKTLSPRWRNSKNCMIPG